MHHALEILHVVTPCVTLLPAIALAFPPATPPAAPEGVRAITVKTVAPRRSLILTVLCFIAVTFFAEGVVLILDLLTSPYRPHAGEHARWWVLSSAWWVVGGLSSYALAALCSEWRLRWGSYWLIVLALLGFGLEVPNLVLSVRREISIREYPSELLAAQVCSQTQTGHIACKAVACASHTSQGRGAARSENAGRRVDLAFRPRVIEEHSQGRHIPVEGRPHSTCAAIASRSYHRAVRKLTCSVRQCRQALVDPRAPDIMPALTRLPHPNRARLISYRSL